MKEISLTLTGNEARAIFYAMHKRKSVQADNVCRKLIAAATDHKAMMRSYKKEAEYAGRNRPQTG